MANVIMKKEDTAVTAYGTTANLGDLSDEARRVKPTAQCAVGSQSGEQAVLATWAEDGNRGGKETRTSDKVFFGGYGGRMTDIFEKVKDRVKIADVVERFGVKLNSRDKGLCPFHDEKTPSFSVKKQDNTWKCFGCGEGGDAIDFVAKLKGIEPLEAVKTLAEMYGIDIASDKPIPKKFDVKAYIQKCIAEVGQTNYFAKRGLTAATVKKYCLGYDSYRKAVVIPYSSKLTYYQTRSVEDKKFFKPKTEDIEKETR